LQIGPVGLASTWNPGGAVRGRGEGSAGVGRPAASFGISETGVLAMPEDYGAATRAFSNGRFRKGVGCSSTSKSGV